MWDYYNDWDDKSDDRREEIARAIREAREDRAAAGRKAKEEADRKAKEEEERRAKIEEHTREHFHWERPYGSKYKPGPEQLALNINDEEMN